jgi:A/G-specific adenine glycosylase
MTVSSRRSANASSADPALAHKLLAWYDVHRRVLPWRAAPGQTADPYAVWLSEIMLQQTTVATVERYFNAFLARWPNFKALAAAPLNDVLAAWAGLGYYARARNLHACAQAVAARHKGRLPRNESELLALPGVGPYTAGAIAAIAFNFPSVAMDGNVERVVSRLFAIDAPLPAAKPLIREKTASFLSNDRPGDFAQALMDLGAGVCSPRAPECDLCPLRGDCVAARSGAQTDYPRKATKGAKPQRRAAAFVLLRGDEVLLMRRPPKGLLGGMSAFPTSPLDADFASEDALRFAPTGAVWRRRDGVVRHVFTHFSLEACVYVAEAKQSSPIAQNWRWAKIGNLSKEGLPTLMRKIALHAGLIR